MKHLEIEWRHLDKDGKTCERCSNTGLEVRRVVEELKAKLENHWVVSFREILLAEDNIPESNAILLNGIPLEQLLPDSQRSDNCCDSCGDLCGKPTLCRTIEYRGRTYETIPAALILGGAKNLLSRNNQ